jgi:hypothetical protein
VQLPPAGTVKFAVQVPEPAFAKSRPVAPSVKTDVLATVACPSKVKLNGTAVLVVPMFTCPKFKLDVAYPFGGIVVAGSVSRTIEVDALAAPDVPVIVTVDVPVGADALDVSVSTELPVVGLGLNDAVTPLGKPDAVRLTAPLKPPSGVTVMVFVPGVLGEICIVPDEAERLNPGGTIVSERLAVAVRVPAVPVIVRG